MLDKSSNDFLALNISVILELCNKRKEELTQSN